MFVMNLLVSKTKQIYVVYSKGLKNDVWFNVMVMSSGGLQMTRFWPSGGVCTGRVCYQCEEEKNVATPIFQTTLRTSHCF